MALPSIGSSYVLTKLYSANGNVDDTVAHDKRVLFGFCPEINMINNK